MSASRARLSQLLTPVVAAAGADLEDLSVTAAGRRSVVRVVVDRDGGIALDDIAEISREVSEALDRIDADEPGLLGAAYVLEVSSPGVDRPLTAPRHWRRNRGRLVQAVRRDGGPAVTGRVVDADAEEDGRVLLEVDGEERELPYADVARGVVQVEFSRKDGAPDDEDAGDDEEDAP